MVRSIIVRLVNLSSGEANATLRTHLPIRHASLVRLDETTVRDLGIVDRNTLSLVAGPHQVVTLRLEFDTT